MPGFRLKGHRAEYFAGHLARFIPGERQPGTECDQHNQQQRRRGLAEYLPHTMVFPETQSEVPSYLARACRATE